MNEINYGGLKQELPENMTRVLIEHNSGTLEFAFYKDGMFKCDSGESWMTPKAVKSWMQISELKFKVGL
jgi:hypothetical protein|tara:strand:+ start:1416 stop:1622 length:207 start_codon:yes stop_codon:yes gene_type:complete